MVVLPVSESESESELLPEGSVSVPVVVEVVSPVVVVRPTVVVLVSVAVPTLVVTLSSPHAVIESATRRPLICPAKLIFDRVMILRV
jgi:hypothetical protein